MKTPSNSREVNDLLSDTFGSPPAADFQTWQERHPEALQHLISRGQRSHSSRRRFTTRAIQLAVAATIVLAVAPGLFYLANRRDRSAAFAQAVAQIGKARKIAWKITFYESRTSKDKTQSWIKTETRERAYKAPGLYREVWRNEKGQIRSYEITDEVNRVELSVDVPKKQAHVRGFAVGLHNAKGPFVWVGDQLKDRNLQFVEKKMSPSGEVNIFRNAFRDQGNNKPWSYDFWLDAKTKKLIAIQVPGSDIYDPEKDTSPPFKPGDKWHSATGACFVERDIDMEAELDESLFSLAPPEGYAVKREDRPAVTEKEMIDYLRILTDFYQGTFPDQVTPFAVSSDKSNAVRAKPKKDRTPAEQKLIETMDHYMQANLNMMPIGHFIEDNIVANSFRYLGKGVKLGDKERIVCWYKPKGSNSLRAVYGDLRVQDVPEQDLPLSIEP